MTTGTARVWTLNPMNMPLTVSLRARRDTTQVMLGCHCGPRGIVNIIIIMAGMAVFLRGWLPHRGKAQMACN